MNYPLWLNRFNFPPDIDKYDLSNQTRALLWGLGIVIDTIEANDGGIETVAGDFIITTTGSYLEFAA